MDDPGLRESDLLPALLGLRRINRVSSPFERQWRIVRAVAAARREDGARAVGARAAGARAVGARADDPLRILDVATGSGDFPRAMAVKAARDGVAVSILGIDRNPAALREAQRLTEPSLPVRYECIDALDGERPLPEADLVTVNLFLHHLDDETAVGFLGRAAAAAPVGLVSDLHRGRAAWWTAWAGGRVLSRSWVVGRDAPDSVGAGFRRDELTSIAERAGLRDVRVRGCFPFRWLLSFGSPS